MASIIERGEVKDPEFRKPRARSVEAAVTPSAKLYTPPEEEPVRTPVPVVPADRVVVSTPVAQSVPFTFPVLKPVGSLAVALLPMPLKFSVIAVPVALIRRRDCAYISGHTSRSIPMSRRYNFLIVHICF
jgi:hypothetical protein